MLYFLIYLILALIGFLLLLMPLLIDRKKKPVKIKQIKNYKYEELNK